MATGCIVNAVRCGRIHCYFTGPFFLLMAVATLLFGVGMLPLGRNGWSWISLTILLGAIAFYYLPELFLGKYRKSPTGSHDRWVSPPRLASVAATLRRHLVLFLCDLRASTPCALR